MATPIDGLEALRERVQADITRLNREQVMRVLMASGMLGAEETAAIMIDARLSDWESAMTAKVMEAIAECHQPIIEREKAMSYAQGKAAGAPRSYGG